MTFKWKPMGNREATQASGVPPSYIEVEDGNLHVNSETLLFDYYMAHPDTVAEAFAHDGETIADHAWQFHTFMQACEWAGIDEESVNVGNDEIFDCPISQADAVREELKRRQAQAERQMHRDRLSNPYAQYEG